MGGKYIYVMIKQQHIWEIYISQGFLLSIEKRKTSFECINNYFIDTYVIICQLLPTPLVYSTYCLSP